MTRKSKYNIPNRQIGSTMTNIFTNSSFIPNTFHIAITVWRVKLPTFRGYDLSDCKFTIRIQYYTKGQNNILSKQHTEANTFIHAAQVYALNFTTIFMTGVCFRYNIISF